MFSSDFKVLMEEKKGVKVYWHWKTENGVRKMTINRLLAERC